MALSKQTVFTEERGKQIIRDIKAGIFVTVAAKRAGVSPNSLYNWCKWGEEEPDEYPELARWSAKYRKAEAHCEARLVGLVQKAAEEDKKFATWLLERRFPRRWGLKLQVALEHEMQGFLDQLEDQLEADTFDKVLSIFAAFNERD